MNLKPVSNSQDNVKTWEQLSAELRDLKALNAVLKNSVSNTSLAPVSTVLVNEEIYRANRALKVLSECKEAMIRADDEAVLLNDICHIIVDVGGYELAWIGYIEKDDIKTVRPVAMAGHDDGYVDNLHIALNDPASSNGPTGISLKTGKPYGSRNVRSDKKMRPWQKEALKRGFLSTLNLPIVYEKQVIGTLAIYSGKVDAFDEDEREMLFGLAQTLAYGITAMRDRCRRIRAEKELIYTNKGLEKRVAERTKKLSESEEKFRVLAETSPAAIFLYQGEKYIYVNPMAEVLTGYSRYQLLTGDAWDWIHPDFRDMVKERARRRQWGEQLPNRYEVKYQAMNGREGWVDFSAGLVEYGGKPAGLAMAFDVSDRKQAEEALRESEKKLRQITENIGEILFIFTPDWKHTIYMSPAYERIWGRPLNGVYSNSMAWLEGVHPDDRELPLAVVNKQIAGYTSDTYTVEFRVLRPDGTIRWVLVHTYPVIDEHGRVYRITGIAEDITRLKDAEKDLRLTQFSIDRAGDIALWLAPDGRFIYANEAASRVFGYTREEFLSMCAFDTNPYFNENNWGDHWNEVKRRGSYTFEAMLRKKDGTFFPGEITVNYLVYEGKEYNCSYIRDITDRRRTEDALTEAKSQAELYLDLMGHDINNLNQIALGYLELADGMVKDDKVRELIKKPLDAIKDSSRLIENVRKLQKVKSGELKIEMIDLGGMLAELRDQYLNVHGKDIAIDYSHCGDCFVMANQLLRDVFSNLIGNAIKHSGTSKSVRIGMLLECVKKDGKEFCKVVVEDDGPGIPDTMKDKVFDRVGKNNAKATGKGLGLYLVKSLLDDFRGTIQVEDRIIGKHKKGARFVVMLPAANK